MKKKFIQKVKHLHFLYQMMDESAQVGKLNDRRNGSYRIVNNRVCLWTY